MSVRPSVGRSVRPSVGWSVTSYFFGLLGATYAVYTTALFLEWILCVSEEIVYDHPACVCQVQSGSKKDLVAGTRRELFIFAERFVLKKKFVCEQH